MARDLTPTSELDVVLKSEVDIGVWFEIRNAAGAVLATSAHFSTICSLEAALGTLARAHREPWGVREAGDETILTIGRRKVRLRGQYTFEALDQVIKTLPDALIKDQRPVNRRRFDLTGARCSVFD